MASLNTFGAILTHAIEMEGQLSDYFQAAGNDSEAKAAARRQQKLTRVRQENVVEITLEPIDGLDESNYVMNLDDHSEAAQKSVAAVAQQFYEDVAPKINVREAQRALAKCGKQYAKLT